MKPSDPATRAILSPAGKSVSRVAEELPALALHIEHQGGTHG
ncbi:hypothetical protein [Defluviimonas sp. WL0002]|nr:hypothetical protein [Defluviimonas sp. WL0002]